MLKILQSDCLNNESFPQLYPGVYSVFDCAIHNKLVSEPGSWLRKFNHNDDFFGNEVRSGEVHREE